MYILGTLGIGLVGSIAGFFFGGRKIRDFLSNVLKLNDLKTEISSSAEQISSVSQEIASSSREQLDTLTTTVSASYEIRSMVERTRDSATSLLTDADELKKSVSMGSDAVGKMVSSSGDIKTSMNHFQTEMRQSIEELNDALKVIQEIAQKTQVINEIVFQTKLLSFNASVEAARAGESGKGFAVVAEEVGKLAQMSGNAAGEISEIVTRSLSTADRAVKSTAEKIDTLAKETIVKADLGFETANACEEIFKVMEEKISTTVDMLKGISAAASEQALGVVQLDESLTKFQEAADRNRLIASQATQHSLSFEQLTKDLAQVSSESLKLMGRDPKTVKTYKKFVWNDRLELRVHAMDEEHKILIGKINDLIETLERNNNKQVGFSQVKHAYADLASYTIEHFADEEKFMASIRYPQLESHKRIHAKLLAQVENFGKELSAGRLDDTKLISFLSSWLISHIMGVDMQYAEVANGGSKRGAKSKNRAA